MRKNIGEFLQTFVGLTLLQPLRRMLLWQQTRQVVEKVLSLLAVKQLFTVIIALIMLAVTAEGFGAATPHKAITLANNVISFKIIQKAQNQLALDYMFNGKSYHAVTLIPQIGKSTAALLFTVEQLNSSNKSGTLIIKTADTHGSMQFSLDPKSKYLKLFNFKNINKLKLNFSSSALVLPDKLGEDLVLYPNQLKPAKLSIPGDNYLLLNMLGDGQAILSCIWNKSTVKLTQRQTVDSKNFTGLDLQPQHGDVLWLGINTAKNIWYQCRQQLTIKPRTLPWQPPFNAQWQMTMQVALSELKAENGQCDSWPLIIVNSSKIPPLVRNGGMGLTRLDLRAWGAGLGSFSYPFANLHGKIIVRYPKFRDLKKSYNSKFFPLIYPLTSIKNNRQNLLLPYDVVKILLPKAIVVAMSTIRDKRSHQPATCGSTEKVEKIFYRDEAKKKRQKIIHTLTRMNKFVLFNRQRIEEYLVWSKKVSQLLAKYNQQQLDPVIANLAKELKVSKVRYNKVRSIIKTPAYCQMLSNKFIKLINTNKDAEIKENEAKLIGRQIRTIGAKQDHLIAIIHYVTKAFRMHTTLLLFTSNDLRQQKILKILRQKTATIIHSKFPMEGK